MPYPTDEIRKARWASVKNKKKRGISYKDIGDELHLATKGSMVLQTVILPKKNFTVSTAKKWLKEHNLEHYLDVKKNTLRARQVSPNKFKPRTFRTKPIGHGIKIVTGKLA